MKIAAFLFLLAGILVGAAGAWEFLTGNVFGKNLRQKYDEDTLRRYSGEEGKAMLISGSGMLMMGFDILFPDVSEVLSYGWILMVVGLVMRKQADRNILCAPEETEELELDITAVQEKELEESAE